MNEQTWRRITGWAGLIVLALALVLLIERLDWLIYPVLGVLPPFVMALILAFVLNPLIVRLENKGVRRNRAVIYVSLAFLLLFAGFALYLIPKTVEQGINLAQDLPGYVSQAGGAVNRFLAQERPLLERFNLPTSVSEALSTFSDQIRAATAASLQTISNLVFTLVGTVLWLLLVPILTVYLLNDWQRIGWKMRNMIPENQKERFLPLIEAVGNVFNSYIRGQFILVVLYGAVTAVILALLGVRYSLVLGLVAGLVSPIPYIGSIIILLSTTIVALAQSGAWGYTALVAVFMLVQNNVLFDNIIAPRVLGGAVGLSLWWSIFALMLGGSMFGIIGMLIAVPVGAIIQVFMRSFFPKLSQEPVDTSKESLELPLDSDS